MAENDDQRSSKMSSSIFETANDVGRDDVSCNSHNEQVSEPLIKYEFDWHSGITAPENRGKRPLILH
jgi:hypothetical protein